MSARVAVPNQLSFQESLPLAINSRAQRRSFFPDNGETFVSTNNNQIHMRLNADAFLDTAHSYLKFKVKVEGKADSDFQPDIGVPWISRIRLSSGGTVIEDIEDWNKLYAFLMLNQSGYDYAFNNGKASGFNQSPCEQENVSGAELVGCSLNYGANGKGIALGADGKTFEYCFPLMTGLFNLDKYLPVLFMTAGIDVDIYLEDANVVGLYTTEAAATPNKFTVTNVEYMGTLINLDADFNMRLKQIIDSTGALQLSGTTFHTIVCDKRKEYRRCAYHPKCRPSTFDPH